RTFQWYGATPDRRSLPTRRSSDLTPRRRRSTNSASTGIASQTDCAPALEQPPEGMPAAGVCAATPGSVPHAVVVQVGWTVAVSLPSACRMSAASWARALSSAAGFDVDWYVFGYTPLAIAFAWSPAPSFFARLSSS